MTSVLAPEGKAAQARREAFRRARRQAHTTAKRRDRKAYEAFMRDEQARIAGLLARQQRA